MKKFLILFFLIASGSASAQTQKPKKLTVSVGFGRSARFTESRFSRRQFNINLTFSYRLSARISANFSVVESLDFKQPLYRGGVSYRIF